MARRGLESDFLDTFVEVHALEHPLPLMVQLTNMVFSGVFRIVSEPEGCLSRGPAAAGFRS
jgi:hypothetical protein